MYGLASHRGGFHLLPMELGSETCKVPNSCVKPQRYPTGSFHYEVSSQSKVGTKMPIKLPRRLLPGFAGILYSRYYITKCTIQQNILTKKNKQLQLFIPLALLAEAGAVMVTVAWDEDITTVAVASVVFAVFFFVDVTLTVDCEVVVEGSVDAIPDILALYLFYGKKYRYRQLQTLRQSW